VTPSDRIVVVGGGPAAFGFVEGYRRAGGRAPLTIVSADSQPPYLRPPLSKALLRGETTPEDVFLASRASYAEPHVELRLEPLATGLDLERRELILGDERLPFGELVITTGSPARRLSLAGFDLEGVHVLRPLDDALAIRHRAEASCPSLAPPHPAFPEDRRPHVPVFPWLC
jgi:3-phenylpropionate/trans-cinnamate dioxygenase ferredoxin reductase subunit